MTNHPNRGAPTAASRPAPEAIIAARQAAGQTQTEAAEEIYSTLRTWQDWEAGQRPMHAGLWMLYRIKTVKPRTWAAVKELLGW